VYFRYDVIIIIQSHNITACMKSARLGSPRKAMGESTHRRPVSRLGKVRDS